MLYLHVTLVPFVDSAGELKTKPTQHSVNELRRIGIHPDIVVCRSKDELSSDIREKIALFADVEPQRSRRQPDVPDVYLVPEQLEARASTSSSARSSGSDACRGPRGVGRADQAHRRRQGEVQIALVGKYVKLHDAYLSVHEALKHAGIHHGCGIRVSWVDAEGCRWRRRRPSSRASTACSSPVGSAHAAGREDPRLPCRPRARDPVPRDLPRHARRDLRVRSSRRRAGRRELDGDGSRDAVPGDRPLARAEGDRGPRRDDAPRRAGRRARRGTRARGRTATRRSCTSGTVTATRSTTTFASSS